jgi:hypothetical protein
MTDTTPAPECGFMWGYRFVCYLPPGHTTPHEAQYNDDGSVVTEPVNPPPDLEYLHQTRYCQRCNRVHQRGLL